MNKLSRRGFLQLAGASSAAAAAGLWGCGEAAPKTGAGGNVVIIGGGFGGATAARYLRQWDPSIKVTLIERNQAYSTCPFSNLTLGGLKTISDQNVSFEGLKKAGVNVVFDEVTKIDFAARKVSTKGGASHGYDRLIVSPGISLNYGPLEGMKEADAAVIPHAWLGGGDQYKLLGDQIKAMKDGGTYVQVCPPDPFRCPPGPYERAGMVAHYLKQNKPKSKIILLDSKSKFSKQGLFLAGWKSEYGSMIEWRGADKDGKVSKIDVKSKTCHTEFGSVKADVLCVIPPQKAGHLAIASGLADEKSGFCPVDFKTFESTKQKNVHVIGDSSIAPPLPKSGYAANSEAKVCAAAVVALLNGEEPGTPSWINTCYSLVGPQYGISVAGVYALNEEGKIAEVKGSGGISGATTDRKLEAVYAQSWYNNIVADTWG